MRDSATYLTIAAFGLGVAADALDKADVPYTLPEDGFVVMTATGSAGLATSIVVQNMINGEETSAPPPAPGHWVFRPTDPSSGGVT